MAGLGVTDAFLPLSSAKSLFPRTLPPNLFGVGLGACRGPPIMLFERAGFPTEGLGCGVDPAFWVLLCGDSGRGSEGLLAFKVGLGTRPGPKDWLNLGAVEVIVCAFSALPFRL